MADGKVQVYNGKVLVVGGKIATADACCCSTQCASSSDCVNAADPSAITLTATIPAGFVDDNCDQCDEDIFGPFVLTYVNNVLTYRYVDNNWCELPFGAGSITLRLQVRATIQCVAGPGTCSVGVTVTIDCPVDFPGWGNQTWYCALADAGLNQTSWRVPFASGPDVTLKDACDKTAHPDYIDLAITA